MSHLEELITEYYEWLGYVVKCGVMVGRRPKGGYEMELDIVAFDPKTNRLLHVEPSLDAHSWETRETRFKKKFAAGKKYILTDLFPWLPSTTEITPIAVLVRAGTAHRTLAGANVITVDEMVGRIRDTVSCRGIASKAAISEHYPLLRTIQFVTCGYYKLAKSDPELLKQTTIA